MEIQTNEENMDCDVRDNKKIVGTSSIPFNLSKKRQSLIEEGVEIGTGYGIEK